MWDENTTKWKQSWHVRMDGKWHEVVLKTTRKTHTDNDYPSRTQNGIMLL